MGVQLSCPKPGTELQVIGAGLSRTGTASFSEALRILLDGPVYHGGTHVSTGMSDISEIRSWIRLLEHWPAHKNADKDLIRGVLKERLSGYAACTDAPAAQLVPELLELYPNAIVVCTVRDAKAWEKSIATISGFALRGFLRFILFPIPAMRPFPYFVDLLAFQWEHLYGEKVPHTTKTYHAHIEWLKKVVPEEKLFFFDVRDGWEPLCKALGKDVPKDVPFPRINDGKAIEEISKKLVTKGLTRWAAMLITAGVAAAAYWKAQA
ncbi:hypothetical protein K458DRAFT_418429 [Lentithecium fluviatile CBS 122367]|uniref:NAD dependent epimerase/dehydratase n=1 Tax=Lentithecium fluviatile CBS 122367 TaxID=1168545 RepID=A0A6G1J0R4_9PLEO|nr:hypothetical protein K458DRAFT_418429 [Lentithecium fluviatile CBS 122367]